MQNFKEKLYNYEAEPPAEIWQNINAQLNSSDTKVVSMSGFRKRSKFIFYGVTAAASLIIIFIISLFFNCCKDIQSLCNYNSSLKKQVKNMQK